VRRSVRRLGDLALAVYIKGGVSGVDLVLGIGCELSDLVEAARRS